MCIINKYCAWVAGDLDRHIFQAQGGLRKGDLNHLSYTYTRVYGVGRYHTNHTVQQTGVNEDIYLNKPLKFNEESITFFNYNIIM